MLSRTAMKILKYLAKGSPRSFDEHGNAKFHPHQFNVDDVVKGLDASEATQAIEDLQGQGYIYQFGPKGIKITDTGFDYYSDHKEDHKPMGFVPKQ